MNARITEQEMLDALHRSGYLFESEITKLLVKKGFFVESNLTSLDPLTGKNREIDLLAEFDHPFNEEKVNDKTVAIARFIFEIKNNNAPLVLLTGYEYSPHSEIYTGLKSATTLPTDMNTAVYYSDFFDILFNMQKKNLYTQYCSFSRKKNEQKKEELMAHHPEMLYSGLQKITHYCEERAESWGSGYRDEYFRDILYLPVFLINEDLYELEVNDNNNTLKKVERSHLVFNYHYNQVPQTSIVHIVTKAGLEDFLTDVLKVERQVEENMAAARVEYYKKNGQKSK